MSFNKPRKAMLDDDVFGTPVSLVAGSTINGLKIGSAATPISGGSMVASGVYVAITGDSLTLPNPTSSQHGDEIILRKSVAVTSVLVTVSGGFTITAYDVNGDEIGSDTAFSLDKNVTLIFTCGPSFNWGVRIA